MWILPVVLMAVAIVIIKLKTNMDWIAMIGTILVGVLLSGLVIGLDYNNQVTDYEVWSGRIVAVEHKEEWDEFHPAKYEEKEIKNSEGKVTGYKTVKVRDAYWEHHPAVNYIETSDEGSIRVTKSMDGEKPFNDHWPNTDAELASVWPIGTPSASVHSYKNLVQASSSLYKHDGINVKDYTDLPEYPMDVTNLINIDRIIGDVPNKQTALVKLADWNAELNKMVPDPEKPGKKKSWKQVNMIFVNVGDKPKEYGFALQEKWENGNKNDFIVAFSTKADGTINWVYPFSWTEIELLKIEVRDYFLELKKIDDFTKVVDDVAKMVADKFERKQMAEFSYVNIDPTNGAIIFVWVINLAMCIAGIYFSQNPTSSGYNRYRY